MAWKPPDNARPFAMQNDYWNLGWPQEGCRCLFSEPVPGKLEEDGGKRKDNDM